MVYVVSLLLVYAIFILFPSEKLLHSEQNQAQENHSGMGD